ASTFGLLMAAVGSAIGLGNIWRFPYITGKYGGGAFLLVYLFVVVLIGLPLMISEFIIGREGRKDAIGSFRKLAPGKPWYISGVLGVLAAFFILSYYSTIAGWSLEYFMKSVTNSFAGQSSEAITGMFGEFVSHPIRPVITQIIFMAITGVVVATGIEKGIERVSKIMVPFLFVLIVILDIRALTLPGGMEGIRFLFKPDLSKIDGTVILGALGHAFYTLSLGMGIIITYGSYIDDKENLGKSALQISVMDTIIALLAGVAIFPAVFAYGVDPTEGPGLVFITLPNIFNQMPGGYLFSILFFLLLSVAALTSTISLMEVVVAFLVDSFKMARKNASVLAFVSITVVGLFSTLSQGPLAHIQLFGNDILDFLDQITANYFLTTAALISIIFLGWFYEKDKVENQLTSGGTVKAGYKSLYYFMIKWVVPIGIILVFLFQLGVFGTLD